MTRLADQETVIVEGLAKRYRIGAAEERSETLAGTLGRALSSPLRNFRRLRGLARFGDDETDDVIWALRDVGFRLQGGTTLGVIGRNGAGKSTLLKILSRITEPTTGRVLIRGRVASLLEVGTGFHPDLTGRDNVYLNATILGMTRREIAARFDEIVEFAEIPRFIDTPVKRYSSGMFVRLAFAVAAHLDPDVLITDEVLAVGDAEFQRKCLGKMREVAGGGRTVIFVSHNRAAVTSLCSRTIWLDGGRIVADGDTDEVMQRYVDSFASTEWGDLATRADRQGDGRLRLERIDFRDSSSSPVAAFRAGEDAEIALGYDSRGAALRNVTVAIYVDTELGERVATISNQFTGDDLGELPPRGEFVCRISELPLNEGTYVCSLKVRVQNAVADRLMDAARFAVVGSSFYPTRLHPPADSGALLLRHSWRARGDVSQTPIAGSLQT